MAVDYGQLDVARLVAVADGTNVGVPPVERTYAGYQRLFEGILPPDTGVYNEYHALLVALAKRHCVKREPRCGGCPVADLCVTGRERADV